MKNQASVRPIITPVILAGGAGTRLWPLSRQNSPKQLHALLGGHSMLGETLLRFADSSKFGPAWLVTSETLSSAVAEQLHSIAPDRGRMVLEPIGRNTAPAAAAVALMAMAEDENAVLLIAPADHSIRDVPGFLDRVALVLPAAMAGRLVTFSVSPTRAETGYGYIKRGHPLPGFSGLYEVAAFVEKPTRDVALQYLASGEYFWNSGMFLFSAKSFLAELEIYAPDIVAGVRDAVAQRTAAQNFSRLGVEAFTRTPAISIDYAVMERSAKVATIPCDIGWTDVGSWGELWNVSEKSPDGNVVIGDAVVIDSRNNYIRGEGRLVAVSGVENLVVVATDDAVLVLNRNSTQDIRAIVEHLNRAHRTELVDHSTVRQQWGIRRTLIGDGTSRARRLTINPGKRLSVQCPVQNSTHLVVVSGSASIALGDKYRILGHTESIDVPAGTAYRLENSGSDPLQVLELQFGPSFDDDDIQVLDTVEAGATKQS